MSLMEIAAKRLPMMEGDPSAKQVAEWLTAHVAAQVGNVEALIETEQVTTFREPVEVASVALWSSAVPEAGVVVFWCDRHGPLDELMLVR